MTTENTEQPAIVGGVEREIGWRVVRGDANSHYFEDRLCVDADDTCIGFLDEDWSDRVLTALTARPSAPAEVGPIGDDETIAEFAFLYRQYGLCPDDQLAPDAIELKHKVLGALKRPSAASVEPGSERDCCKPDDVTIPRSYLESWLVTLQHARTFIVSRQKMHPTGVGLYDDDIARIAAILARPAADGAK